jgi:hypothetical protein
MDKSRRLLCDWRLYPLAVRRPRCVDLSGGSNPRYTAASISAGPRISDPRTDSGRDPASRELSPPPGVMAKRFSGQNLVWYFEERGVKGAVYFNLTGDSLETLPYRVQSNMRKYRLRQCEVECVVGKWRIKIARTDKIRFSRGMRSFRPQDASSISYPASSRAMLESIPT